MKLLARNAENTSLSVLRLFLSFKRLWAKAENVASVFPKSAKAENTHYFGVIMNSPCIIFIKGVRTPKGLTDKMSIFLEFSAAKVLLYTSLKCFVLE